MPWHVYSCALSDRNAQILITDAFVRSRPSPQCPHLLWVGIWGHLPHEGAFWHPDESEALDDLEDGLLEALSSHVDGNVVYAFRLASGGIREYFFYCSEPTAALLVGQNWAHSHPDYRIELDQRPDPSWQQYLKYVVINDP